MLERFLDPQTVERVSAACKNPDVMIVPSLLTIAIELTLPFLLWWPRARPLAMLAGVLFHLNIAIVMNIMAFSLAMIAGYLLFLDPETVPALLRRLARRMNLTPVRSGPGSRSLPAARQARRLGAASSAESSPPGKPRELP
jgi:hypothetical protein